jgi:TPR repeat protein
VRGNPPKEIYTESNCDKCDLTGRSTLSKNCCSGFKHLYGATITFPVETKEPNTTAGRMLEGLDESSRSFMNAIFDYANEQGKVAIAQKHFNNRIQDDDFDDEVEIVFSRDMAEQARANERTTELLEEGMNHKFMFKEQAVEFMHLLDKARSGNPKAQYEFAQAFWNGTHGAADMQLLSTLNKMYIPSKWYDKSADNGYPYAQLRKGITYRNDAVENQNLEDHKKAVYWLEKALSHSEIRERDQAKDGVYLRALNSSRITLGVSYINGKKEKPDFHKAMSYFGAVEDSGDSRGGEWKKKVDDLCKELKESLQNMKDAAEYGSDDALNILGMIYGGYSEYKQYQLIVEVDRQKSFEYFQKAAYADNPDAMDNLGNCFKNGDGVEKDITKAVEWYKKAAEIGWPSGLFHYATCLRKGNGVEKDEKEAIKWYMKAGIGGHAKALNVLGWCAEGGRGMNEDPELAFEWYRLAAEAGDAESMYDLGRCYHNGYGCDENGSLGDEWQAKAKENGYYGGW